MTRIGVAVLHAGYWLLYLLLLALLLLIGRLPDRITPAVAAQLVASPLVVLAIAPSLAAFYASYSMLFPRYAATRRFRVLIPAAALVCLATAAAGLLLLYVVYGGHQPVFRSGRELSGLLLLLALLAAVHACVALVVRGFVGYYRESALREALVRKTHETELALVRSRLDPHFLFNTLNNLDALIAKDPAAASEYLNRLSAIMRFVLYESKAELIPLAQELDYLDRYISLERLRTRRAGYATHEVVGSPDGLSIAPMTLIPFVENAFTHAEGRKEDGTVASRVVIEGGRLTYECVNHFRARSALRVESRGIGHTLVQQRLQLLYPDRHALEAGACGDRYYVRLTIEMHDPLHHR